MAGKKELLARFLFANSNYLSSFLLKVKNQSLSILVYHRVVEKMPHGYPFNADTISVEVEMFRQQLSFLKENFNVINFRDLDDYISSGKSVPKNTVIITFDDGYKDVNKVALPCLNDFGLTATVFVATQFIENQELFWFDKFAFYFNQTETKKFSFEGVDLEVDLSEIGRREARYAFGKAASQVSDELRLDLLAQLRRQAKVEVSEEQFRLAAPMNWDEVAELESSGLEVGSHGVGHGFWDQLTDEQLLKEIKGSRDTLYQKLGKAPVSISYPAGKYDERVIRLAKDVGYKFGVANLRSEKNFEKGSMMELPRIDVERDVSFNLFKGSLLLPSLFS